MDAGKLLLAYGRLPALLANPWRDPAAIRRIQERKLRRLYRHAWDRVPYYRALFESAGLDRDAVRGLDDLALIPLTDKSRLRDLPLEERTARGVEPARCREFSTSGTSGVPLRTLFAREDAAMKSLAWIRCFSHVGLRPWDRTSAFVGRRDVRAKRSWYERLGLWRRREISAWDDPGAWIEALRRWRPRAVLGYVMTLRALAEALEARPGAAPRPGLVIHSSASLDRGSRDFLAGALGSRIVDIYGSDEGGCLAWECASCGGYHVSADTVLLEVLRDGKPASPGEDGEVVITNLHAFAMPFIRYRQEDVARVAVRGASCGRRFPLLEAVLGREDDFIRLPGGAKLSPHPFYHCLDPVPGIRRWRIVQDGEAELRVEIEPGPGFDRGAIPAVAESVSAAARGAIRVRVLVVEKILVEPGRKFRAVSSLTAGGAR